MPANDDAAIDVGLVARVANGDRDALSDLYGRHATGLLGTASRIVRDHHAAEDLLHDVFVEVWRTASHYDPARARVRTWLTLRIRSRALDLRKSARVARAAVDAVGDVALRDLVDESERASVDSQLVPGLLDCLSAVQRRMIELAYFDGLSCSEIAAGVDVPLGTVKSRIATGLERLRLELATRQPRRP